MYDTTIKEFIKNRDFDGALDFLGKIFHDPENKKKKSAPTDYLDNDEHEDSRKKKTAGAGFDEMTVNFKLRSKITERIDFILEGFEESRNEDSDMSIAIQYQSL
jgi:hypothetical protein